jgi:hypothetical protein
MSNDEESRVVPSSDLDFQSMITTPVWSKSSAISSEMKEALASIKIVRHYKKGDSRVNQMTGEVEICNQDITIETELNEWGKLGYLTQDLRLSNLDKNEVNHCIENLDLGFSLLQFGCPKSFLICVDEVAHILELSHSKNGWFRQGLNTLRTESRQDITQKDEKGNFFGIKK